MPDTRPLTPCGHCGHRAPTLCRRWRRGHWYECSNCHKGSFAYDPTEQIWPAAPMGGGVQGLPPDVDRAWTEARTAASAGAYTASEIMCRKILMHIAVDKAESEPGKKFYEYVNDLDSSGYITVGLKPVIDIVRERGNTAAHELPATSRDTAEVTLRITEHLLTSTYALPSLATKVPSEEAAPRTGASGSGSMTGEG